MFIVYDCYLTSKPEHTSAICGSNVTLLCRSNKHGVRWRHVGPRRWRSFAINDTSSNVDDNGNLHLFSVTKSDSGTYRCEDPQEAAYAELQILGKTLYNRILTHFLF